MHRLFSIGAAAALMLSGAGAVAAELPTYEITGFPLSPVQFAAVSSAQVQERAPTPTLMLGGMPASPMQIMVLTKRPQTAAVTTSTTLTQAAFQGPQPN